MSGEPEHARRRRLPGVAKAIAVASGKGGVGKTTVAVNLALALASGGRRVGIFDADLYGPNVPLMLGLRRTRPAGAMVPIYRRQDAPYLAPVKRYGLAVMSMGFLVGEGDAVLPDPRFAGRLVSQTLRDVRWPGLDYLVVDLPPGTGDPQQSLIESVHLDGAIIVTTPQDLSLLDAGRAIDAFGKAGVAVLGVIENMAYAQCPHCGERIELFHHSDRRWEAVGGLPVLGRIPMRADVSAAIDAGHPLVASSPGSLVAAIFLEVAAAVRSRLE